MNDIGEKLLDLPDGRVLAYADSGTAISSTVILFFHGTFGVGEASRISPVILDKNIHYVAPTLPGWGNSSPIKSSAASYASIFASDITALITHLHPDDPDLKLYICGGSFGTIHAQILFGLSYDVFPLGPYISGLLLISPLSPPHCDKSYAKLLPLPNYFMIGPPSHYIPFGLIPRIGKFVIGRQLKSAETAVGFIQETVFDTMGEGERESYARWRNNYGFVEGELERELAEKVVRSVAVTWDGFLILPDVYHSGWGGVHPNKLDDAHARHPVLVVSGKHDRMVPKAMADWLVANYKNGRLKSFDGGHNVALFHMDEIWEEFLSLEDLVDV